MKRKTTTKVVVDDGDSSSSRSAVPLKTRSLAMVVDEEENRMPRRVASRSVA